MNRPLVSVITPTYNAEKYIRQTVESVMDQTFPDWEMICVDDCSNDGTVAQLRSLQEHDSRIKLFQLEKNSGPGVARDLAVQKAVGRYLAFLDADDLWKPEKLAKQVAFMHQEHQPFTFCFYDWMTEDGKLVGKTVTTPDPLTYKHMRYCNHVGNLTGIYDTERFGKIPISGIRKRQDFMLWMTILKEIKSARPVPESLAVYRLRDRSLSSSKLKNLRANFDFYRQHYQESPLRAAVSLSINVYHQLFVKPRFLLPSVATPADLMSKANERPAQ